MSVHYERNRNRWVVPWRLAVRWTDLEADAGLVRVALQRAREFLGDLEPCGAAVRGSVIAAFHNLGRMGESAEKPRPASSAPGAELNARNRRVLREARTEAVIVLAFDVALLGGLAAVDRAKGWQIVDLHWWSWLLLASPALLLMVLLLVAPLADMSPGRVRNASVALLGLLIAADAVAVGVLLAALAGSDAGSLSAGELLAHGVVVWLTNIVTFGLLFWMLDEGGPRVRAERGRPDPDFQFPQDAAGRSDWSPRLSDYLYVSLTNAIAVSPTDTMPLTRRAKGLMAIESLISYAVVILVVARAVNVL